MMLMTYQHIDLAAMVHNVSVCVVPPGLSLQCSGFLLHSQWMANSHPSVSINYKYVAFVI